MGPAAGLENFTGGAPVAKEPCRRPLKSWRFHGLEDCGVCGSHRLGGGWGLAGGFAVGMASDGNSGADWIADGGAFSFCGVCYRDDCWRDFAGCGVAICGGDRLLGWLRGVVVLVLGMPFLVAAGFVISPG